jgi:hydroxypyruvate isomerase
MSYTVNCSIIFTDLPLHSRPAAAKAAGFDSVEFWWPFAGGAPRDDEVSRFERAILDAGVQLTGLNFDAGDMPAGDRGLVSWNGKSERFRDSVAAAVGIGGRLGCRAFNALYGNRLEDGSPESQDALALENLTFAADAVRAIDGIVLLEPVSGAPRYPLHTASDVLSVIDALESGGGATNVRLLADFYHLAINGDNVTAVIERHAQNFGHIQIADAPGRGEPGTGNLPLDSWVRRSYELGYEGAVGLEYKPTTDAPFAWLEKGRPSRK